MSSLNDYLAKKYGAKPTTTQGESSKKKKKKRVKSMPTADKLGSVAIIDEEDITGQWKNIHSEDENDEEAPIVGNFIFIKRNYYCCSNLFFFSILDFSVAEIQQRSNKWKPIVNDVGDEAPQIG